MIVTVDVVAPPVESEVTRYKVAACGVVGVPEMIPVAEARASPAGSAGTTEKATGVPLTITGTIGAMATPEGKE